MNQERLMQIIKAPRVSEKSTRLADSNRQYVFQVASDAAKPEIKQAVELMFSVKVDSVQVCNQKGKSKLFRRNTGKRADIRKAYVKLKEGFDIDFLGAE